MVIFSDIVYVALLFVGAIFAFLSGFYLWRTVDLVFRTREQKQRLGNLWGISSGRDALMSSSGNIAVRREKGKPGSNRKDISGKVLNYASKLSQMIKIGKCRKFAPKLLVDISSKKFIEACQKSGYGERISVEGFCEAQVRLSLVIGFSGFLVGLIFSSALAVLLLVVGGFFGFRMPASALRRQSEDRAREAEKHLPEMLDVVALGMRSGLSFDASLRLYASHFDTMLASELQNAQQQWTSGLTLRDEALRKIASSYDSVILSRVVETVIRSVRYGSSMVESLESDAAEARAIYQARREERVAKAPVKMMIPTGTLILPAMLILVLGPVLLELIEGGL